MPNGEAKKPDNAIWKWLTRANAAWTIGGIAITIIVALITSSIYVSDLLRKIDRLDRQVKSINSALSAAGSKTDNKDFILNGPEDTRCPDGALMAGLRLDGNNFRHATLECAHISPAPTD